MGEFQPFLYPSLILLGWGILSGTARGSDGFVDWRLKGHLCLGLPLPRGTEHRQCPWYRGRAQSIIWGPLGWPVRVLSYDFKEKGLPAFLATFYHDSDSLYNENANWGKLKAVPSVLF